MEELESKTKELNEVKESLKEIKPAHENLKKKLTTTEHELDEMKEKNEKLSKEVDLVNKEAIKYKEEKNEVRVASITSPPPCQIFVNRSV